MDTNKDQLFISRLNHHPKLRERMESLLHVVENTAGVVVLQMKLIIDIRY